MFRFHIAVLIVMGCWMQATAEESNAVFVPHTRLTEQELDEYKAELVDEHGWSESTAEEFVRGASRERFKFTDDDVRAAFREILPSDNRDSICSNSIMSGATRLVYVSPPSKSSVTVKSSVCAPVDGGLSCSPLSVHEFYYFETPSIRFTLDDDVSPDEAIQLLTTFRDNGIRGLPEWYERQRFGYKDVTHIGRSGIWYVLQLGEFYCRGCTATFKVLVDSEDGGEPALVLDAEPEGMCI